MTMMTENTRIPRGSRRRRPICEHLSARQSDSQSFMWAQGRVADGDEARTR